MTIARVFLLLVACAATASAQIRPRGGGQGNPLPQSDEELIRAARIESNQALARRDLTRLSQRWLPEYYMLSSRNEQSVGRDSARASFRRTFSSRANVVYVREPAKIEVNQSWGHAAETGRWTGRWSDSYGSTRVAGVYFAKWRKVNGQWMLLGEMFVQTECAGARYCATPPTE
jgi:hypothetical protein